VGASLDLTTNRPTVLTATKVNGPVHAEQTSYSAIYLANSATGGCSYTRSHVHIKTMSIVSRWKC